MDELFAFEGLDVYKKSLEFARKIQSIVEKVKIRHFWCDQIHRAATSVVLNLAEGSGRWHKNDKRNFYFIARGSAFECVPLVDLGVSSKFIEDNQREGLRNDLKSICQMLTKLIQSLK